jgi:hypothetical protein
MINLGANDIAERMNKAVGETVDRVAPKITTPEYNVDLSKPEEKQKPFQFVHLHLIKGEQKSGKTATAVARVRDYVYLDCVKEYLKKEKGLDSTVPSSWENPNSIKGIVILHYDKKRRIAKLQINKRVGHSYKSIIKWIPIPKNYKLRSNMKIYSVIHIYNIPCLFAYCTWEQMLYGLKTGRIKDAWIILDQYEIVGSARDGQSRVGKFLYKNNNQWAKRHLEVYIIAPSDREVDWTIRQMRNEDIECRRIIGTDITELDIRKTGSRGVLHTSFDTSEYYNNYDADELIPTPSQKVLKEMGVFDD